jgi:DNA repair protein RecO (recombination protein O)
MLPAGGDALMALFYLNELLLRMTARLDPHPELYEVYAGAVAAVTSGEAVPGVLRRFEKRLLDTLGYGLDLGHDTAGEPIEAAASYRYDPTAGLAPCRPDTPGALLGASLLALAEDRPAGARALADARRLLRAAIDVHLDGRPLKTREMLGQLRGKGPG